MTLNERYQNVAVIGAGGKMGSGISLLLAQELTLRQLHPDNTGKKFRLILMDVSADALEGLKSYLAKQAERFVQKKGEKLAAAIPALATPDAAATFVAAMNGLLETTTDLKGLAGSTLVFEAILEKLDLKLKIYKELKEICHPQAFFFTNTSSIPIKALDEGAHLDGRVIGFHFYNPPAVQRLVELIIPEKVAAGLEEMSVQIGRDLGKIIIPANDVAGFIGNGHFMRDGLHGMAAAQQLAGQRSLFQSIYMINRVSQEWLVRPMGIFQLIDYVGLDIFQSILKIMEPYFPDENLHSELIDRMVAAGVKGGQFSDGSQKNGFLKYEEGRIAGVYDLDGGKYRSLGSEDWRSEADHALGSLPAGYHSWKSLVKDPEAGEKLAAYFGKLVTNQQPGAQLAKAYLERSKAIGELLVSGGVARSAGDVNGVLMNGFFHLYGPVNNYV